jgi:hypothetical protein
MSTPVAPKAQAAHPFAHTAVSDLDHEDLVDVAGLHADARQLLSRSLRQASRGFGQLVALVGDPGSGKSHLLWWLKRQHRPESLVVAIPALPDLAQPFRFTLKQVVSGLCRVDRKGSPLERPIDRLLWDVIYAQTYDLLDAARVGMYQGPTAVLKQLGPLCLDGGRRRALGDFAESAQKIWPQIEPGLRSYLLTLPTENSLDATARQVLVQFPYADRRALVTAWLAGEELAAKDRERISAKQTINQEATARYVLCSLMRLASVRRPASITILFDQADQLLEQLGQPGLHALAEVIGSLHGLVAATLLILSCRPDTFGQFSEKQARPGPSQLKQSMELISLSRATPLELREVVAARLQAVTGGSGPVGSLSPLVESDLGFLHEIETPRAALSRLASVYGERLAKGTAPAGVKSVAEAKSTAPNKSVAQGKSLAVKSEPPSAVKPVAAVKSVVSAASKSAVEKKSVVPDKAAPQSAVPTATKEPESAATPSRAWLAMSGEGDVLADAIAQAAADGVGVEKPRSVTHVDKSGPSVPREAKPSPVPAKSVTPAAAMKPSAAPVSRADSGDTVRRVPDDALIAKSKESSLKVPAGPVKVSAPAAVKPSVAGAKASPAPAVKSIPAAVKASPAPAKPAEDPAPVHAPSADSPSKAWLDMAGDNDPLADAIAAARAELAPSFAAEAAKPIKAKPVEPLPKTSKPLVPTDFEPTRQIVIPPGELGFGNFGAGDEPSRTQMSSAPSADSPSVSWLAMAADESALSSSEPSSKAEPPKTARPVRGTAAMGVVMVKPSAAKAAAQTTGGAVAARSGARSTQARMPAVAVRSGSLSPTRILAAMEGRSSMPEWQLAEKLAESIDRLSEVLNQMASDGQVRLVPSEDGRMVVPL